MKKQVLVIHGGETFKSDTEAFKFLSDWEINIEDYRTPKDGWKKNLRPMLGDGYDVILPRMPNEMDAKYLEWKVWFEKFIPYLNDGSILVGHSLGGSFLAKYFSENDFPYKLKAVFLVAACFEKDLFGYGLASFILPGKLHIPCEKIFLYHSKDDPVVPFADLERFHNALPSATVRIFDNRGHFNQEEFPELVKDIKSLN